MDEIFNKFLKYLIISLITLMSTLFIPSNNIKSEEGLIITFIVAITYALLDRILPSIKYENKL